MFQDIGVSKDLNDKFKSHLANTEALDCKSIVINCCGCVVVTVMVTSRFVPMDVSDPDDSYPDSDVSYPLSVSSYQTLWSIRTHQKTPSNYDTKCLRQT